MDSFFRYISAFPMPLWVAMMFAPNHSLTERASRSSSIFGMAAFNYVLALVQALRLGASQKQGLPDFTTLDGISAGLGTKEGALGAWAHMLALDLFTGAWIYRQCQRLNAPAGIRISALVFTLMTGPFGLLLFFLWRAIGARQERTSYSFAD